ncbi:MAG: tRNA dihydrouridine synthase DusB [Opitutaceae bacterium]|nr:tRNA dihydrouridine synthase DusB [Opitutaceae bacterium]
MQLGSLKLKSNLFLSPLAGYTNLPFRLTVRELGGLDLATTDLVNARSLLEGSRVSKKLVATCPEDSPLAVQLFGAVPEEMRDAALMLEEMGIDSIDINMGCPVDKVTRTGSGSTMMREIGETGKLVATIVDAVKIPVTAKMRLGWDSENLTASDLARELVGNGIAGIFVHGRTRQQGFSGKVSLEGIRTVVEAIAGTPVIGNGDVTTLDAAKRMFDETGCAGVSMGRGAFYNPWLFCHTAHFLRTGERLPEPNFEERVTVMYRHLDYMIGFHEEEMGCKFFRKVIPWYAKRLGPSNYLKKQIFALKSRRDFDMIIKKYREWRLQFLDEAGELLPRYQPAPLYSSFMNEEVDGRQDSIPVPKGPIDVW